MDRLAKDRLTRPDEFVSMFGGIAGWISQHRREALFVLGIVMILGIGIGTRQWWQHRADSEAADAFGRILANVPGEANSGTASWQKVADETSVFIDKHGSSTLAPAVSLYRGRALLALAKYEDSLSAFSTAEAGLEVPEKYLAMEGRANALMQLKKWKEAAALWTTLSKAENNPLREIHTWNLGVAQEGSGEKVAEIATLKDFEARFMNSPMLEQVRSKLAALGSKP